MLRTRKRDLRLLLSHDGGAELTKTLIIVRTLTKARFSMKKILVIDVPEHIDKISISYASLVGVSTKQVKLHSLPQPKKTDIEDLTQASIAMCQDTGWNMCLDAIRNLSE